MKTTVTLEELSKAIKGNSPIGAEMLLAQHVAERELERFADFFWGFVTCLFLCVCALGVYYAFR